MRGVSLEVAAGVTLPFALLTILLMRLVLRSRSWKPATGREQLVGTAAEVTDPLTQVPEGDVFQGMVRLHGELWRAVAREAIPAGANVRVTRIEGLTLHVTPSRPSDGWRPGVCAAWMKNVKEAQAIPRRRKAWITRCTG